MKFEVAKLMKGFVFTILAALLLCCVIASIAAAAGVPSRAEVLDQYKWRTSDLFASDDEWEKAFGEAKVLIETLEQYKGHIGESPNVLLEYIKASEAMWLKADKVYLYAYLKKDEDTKVALYQGFSERAEALETDAAAADSFIEPELLALPDGTLAKFMEQEPQLKVFSHYFDTLMKRKPHTLSASEEELLAMAGDLAGQPQRIFNVFKGSDLKFDPVKDASGQEVAVSEPRLSVALQNPDRKYRQDFLTSVYGAYDKYANTLAALLSAQVKKDIFYSKARKYETSLEAALASSLLPPSLYDSLVKAVNQNLGPLHKYVSLRKRVLGLDSVHQYDMYVPLLKANTQMVIKYDEAKAIVAEGLAPLGKSYVAQLQKALDSGWVDVFENQNKRTGGYNISVYGCHPYVLLNYVDDFGSMSTLAHEMGHAMHSFYTCLNQPYIYSSYGIFLAEVASTTNEVLVQRYMLNKVKDKNERLYLLNKMIEDIRGSIYTQIMYAEFEKVIHERAEDGQSLTAKDMQGIWGDLMQKYFGPDFVVDPVAKAWWSRIPHFYMNFYVYKYSTGMTAAVAFADKLLSGGPEAQEKYLNFLKSGSSEYPIETLKAAGVDMTDPAALQAALNLFGALVDEMEALLVN